MEPGNWEKVLENHCERIGIDTKSVSRAPCSLEEAYYLRLENEVLKEKIRLLEKDREAKLALKDKQIGWSRRQLVEAQKKLSALKMESLEEQEADTINTEDRLYENPTSSCLETKMWPFFVQRRCGLRSSSMSVEMEESLGITPLPSSNETSNGSITSIDLNTSSSLYSESEPEDTWAIREDLPEKKDCGESGAWKIVNQSVTQEENSFCVRFELRRENEKFDQKYANIIQ